MTRSASLYCSFLHWQDGNTIISRLSKLLGNVIISQGGVGESHIFLMVIFYISDLLPVPHIAPELLPLKSKGKGGIEASQEI